MVALAQRSRAVQASALASGALVPLATEVLPLPGCDPFVVRRLISATPKHLKRAGPKANPFRPWDPRLEVEQLHHHVVLLNKYPVQPGHLLLINNHWAPQNGWLQQQDWSAVIELWRQQDGLWFFNSCPEAGASQPHRHLQLLPRHAEEASCPLVNQLISADGGGGTAWGGAMACRNIPAPSELQPEHLVEAYQELAQELGFGDPELDAKPQGFYNLLFANGWMAMVARSRESHAGFSVNALGFAGYLLATEGCDLQWLQQHGPLQLLAAVSG